MQKRRSGTVLGTLAGIVLSTLLGFSSPQKASAACIIWPPGGGQFNTCPNNGASWTNLGPGGVVFSGCWAINKFDLRMQNQTSATSKQLTAYRCSTGAAFSSITGSSQPLILFANYGPGNDYSRCRNPLANGAINVQCWISI